MEKQIAFDDSHSSLNYLLPPANKKPLQDIKGRMERKNPVNRAILYDPLFPRKYISVTLLSSYCYFNSFIRNFIDEVYDSYLIE